VGSDRFVVKLMTPEKFRSLVTDLDWTQIPQRQGTFTLNSEMSTSMTSSTTTINTPAHSARSVGVNFEKGRAGSILTPASAKISGTNKNGRFYTILLKIKAPKIT